MRMKSPNTFWSQLTQVVKAQCAAFWRDEVSEGSVRERSVPERSVPGRSEAVLQHTSKPWGARTVADDARSRVTASNANDPRPSSQELARLIKPHTLIVCEDDIPFAILECLENSATLRLTKDALGRSRTLPLAWVKRVNDRIYLDRTCEEASREWAKLGSSPNASFVPVPS
jgi:hypothetical protein